MEKKNPADIAADEYFELQMAHAKRSKISDVLLVLILALFVFAVAVCVWAVPHKDFSEDENRYLATGGDIDFFADLMSGKLTEEIADIYSDQFPLRRALVEIKAILELASFKHENNGVILGQNGALIDRLEYSAEDEQTIKENLSAIESFCDVLRKKGISVEFALAPRSIDVLSEYLPALYSGERNGSVKKLLGEAGISYLDLEAAIKQNGKGYVWFLTDHHWTPLGAYYAYDALGESLGFEPFDLSHFNAESVSESFFGTTYSKAGIYSVKPDEITLLRYAGDSDFKVTNGETGEIILDGFYDRGKLEEKDKYSVFLGGDYGHIKIAGGEKKERLLVIKDSYFDSIAPFLARHFELDVIDLRYYSGSAAEYASLSGADKILILCGADSLATSSVFTQLEYKLYQ